MKYIIKDWIGNHIYQNKEFDTFEDAWDFLYKQFADDLTEEDGTFDDYFVIIKE